jgi:hypothetical protein
LTDQTKSPIQSARNHNILDKPECVVQFAEPLGSGGGGVAGITNVGLGHSVKHAISMYGNE